MKVSTSFSKVKENEKFGATTIFRFNKQKGIIEFKNTVKQNNLINLDEFFFKTRVF